ncbi:MAG: hypothetical protein WCS27_15825 [Victivallaceae bacterium]
MGNYKSVTDMVNDVFESPDFTRDVQKEVEETQLIHELVKQRIKLGKSQTDIAKIWQCDTSTVCRFENKKDEDVKLGELAKYCNAIGSGLGVHIASPFHSRAAALINCVTQIDNHLKELTKLARECNDDDLIVEEITRFQADVLLDIMKKASQHTDDIIERIDLVKPVSKSVNIENKCELIEV